MLFVNQICKSFNRTRVIDHITFSQSSNEFIALMGKNGSGKTTTLRMIARVMRPDSGNILFHNNDLLSHKSIFRSKILYLGHEPGMYSHFSPFENLQFALFFFSSSYLKVYQLLYLSPQFLYQGYQNLHFQEYFFNSKILSSFILFVKLSSLPKKITLVVG